MNLIEKVIVCKMIEELDSAGFVPVKFWDGEGYQDIANPMDNAASPVRREKACIDAINTVDEGTLHFARKADLQDWGRFGALLILGHGEDVISDYHCASDYPEFSAAFGRVYAYIDKGGQ